MVNIISFIWSTVKCNNIHDSPSSDPMRCAHTPRISFICMCSECRFTVHIEPSVWIAADSRRRVGALLGAERYYAIGNVQPTEQPTARDNKMREQQWLD